MKHSIIFKWCVYLLNSSSALSLQLRALIPWSSNLAAVFAKVRTAISFDFCFWRPNAPSSTISLVPPWGHCLWELQGDGSAGENTHRLRHIQTQTHAHASTFHFYSRQRKGSTWEWAQRWSDSSPCSLPLENSPGMFVHSILNLPIREKTQGLSTFCNKEETKVT